jgi:tRNA threonylcarbamoyladenosine modification (KEOPS) complex  Pcc1 subunit
MKCSGRVWVDDPQVYPLIKPELERFSGKRSHIELSQQDGTLIEVSADDVVALRSALDSALQLLKVYESVSKVR